MNEVSSTNQIKPKIELKTIKLRGFGKVGELRLTVNQVRKFSRFESFKPHQIDENKKQQEMKDLLFFYFILVFIWVLIYNYFMLIK